MSKTEHRVAVWSGPRNISTAMMRSWGNRPDTFVCDEPFYAHYLLTHGEDHPVRDEIIAAQENDADKVIDWLTGPIPHGKSVFYQKLMTHHMLPSVPREWVMQVSNVFLIREPREMVTSLMQITPDPDILDTGLPQQVELFELVRERSGETPPVIDARDVLLDPPHLLERMCGAVGVEFDDCMLSWPPGRRETDGVWAPHWYASVERSTGWAPYRPKEVEVPERLLPVYEQCQQYYEQLYVHRLT